jgi:hypothetical protein
MVVLADTSMSTPSGDDDASPQEYLADVQDYLTTRGWTLDLTQVAETVFLFGGTTTANDGTDRRGVVIVATGAGDELGREHVKYLRKAVRKYDADVAFAHARNGTDDSIEDLCAEHGIRLIDGEDVRGGSELDEGAVDDLSFPDKESTAPTESDDPDATPAVTGAERAEPSGGDGTAVQSSGIVEVVRGNLTRGGLHGAGAWVLGYLVVFLLGMLDNYEYPGGITPFRANGWVFYGTHTVPLEASGARQGVSATRTLEVFGSPSPFDGLALTVPGIVYHLVPVIVLAGAGYLLVGNAEDAGTGVSGTAAGVALGATLSAGYLLLTVVGQSVFSFEYTVRRAGLAGGTYTLAAAPEFTSSVLLAGLAYPILFGSAGAVVATVRR